MGEKQSLWRSSAHDVLPPGKELLRPNTLLFPAPLCPTRCVGTKQSQAPWQDIMFKHMMGPLQWNKDF